MIRPLSLICVIIAAALPLAGCGSLTAVGDDEFACKSTAGGVPCLSARDAYERTHHVDSLSIEPADGSAPIVDTPPPPNSAPRVPLPDYTASTPVRRPARDIRVWIAPWVDTHKTLHLGGYVIAPVAEREYLLGEYLVRDQSAITPLRSDTFKDAD